MQYLKSETVQTVPTSYH